MSTTGLSNPVVDQNISPNKAPSKHTSIYRQLKESINTMKLLTEYLQLEKEKCRLENEKINATLMLLYSQHITTITSKQECVNIIAEQNEEQYEITPISITLHDPNVVQKASVVETPTAITEPANTSDKYVSIPIRLIVNVPSSEDQPLTSILPQLVVNIPVADTVIKADVSEAAQAHYHPEAVSNRQFALLQSAQLPITLYSGCKAKVTGYKQSRPPYLPSLVQLAITAHRLLHHLSYAQLVNLVPFDPGGK